MTVDRESIRAAARAQLEQRLTLVDDLATALEEISTTEQALRDAQARVETARTAYAAAHKNALNGGWTARELKESRLPAPHRDRPAKPARLRTAKAT